MANQIKLVSISELLEENFYIPSYQRGYRWTSQQVLELLEDVHAFALKPKSKKEFYCLQPVVVKAFCWEQDGESVAGWEVVDGQQRLTTIRILLSYLVDKHLRGSSLKEEFGKDLFSIAYETRPGSKAFLDDIALSGESLNIDFHHIRNAYLTIDDWFGKQLKKNDVRQSILSTLTHNLSDQKSEGILQVIWYKIENEQNPIDTFIRINMGKIPLTDAELIKALFLQDRLFGDGQEIGHIRQLEIARDWDQIENALQNNEFWWFLNKAENKVSSRISLIFELIFEMSTVEGTSLVPEDGADQHKIFRFYNAKFEQIKGFADLQGEWQRVKEMFQCFEEWFQHPVWFHYIGFLIYCGESIRSIYELTSKEPLKDKITGFLVSRIAAQLAGVKWADSGTGAYLDLTYPKNDGLIKRVLLLFNLVPIIRQSESGKLIYKFPFQAFKQQHWDTEHIDSYRSRNMNSRKDQLEWLEFAMDDLNEILGDKPLLDEVVNFMIDPNSRYSFEYLARKISEASGEAPDDLADESIKNNIGNLTLLNSHLNRSYGNALFPTKRRKIIEFDVVGDFMPMNTKNVFLKYYDPMGKSRTQWSRSDMEKYRSMIADSLMEFLPPCNFKPHSDEQI
ncbi:DUF262 domain-containing protein [Pedobacter sp. GR22-6]|uniref:DUF262 domain-containing protein n=1 Tax=Pedobacter sp. GR22-6 TaxID=3127957 RepID=UPI00307EB2D4